MPFRGPGLPKIPHDAQRRNGLAVLEVVELPGSPQGRERRSGLSEQLALFLDLVVHVLGR